MRVRRQTPSRRRGTAAVEAAIILPVLVGLMFGVWEVGRIVQLNQQLNNAAREGARLAAGGMNLGNPVTVAMVQTAVQNNLTAAGFPSAAVTGSVVTLTNLSSNSWTDPCDATPLDHFRVSVTIPSGTPFNALRWTSTSYITGVTQLSTYVDWLSANDSEVTVSTSLPF